MSYTWSQILISSIFIPAVLGLFRLRKINPAHYPFIILLWVGGFNEVISFCTAKYFRNTAPNTNIYCLLEVLIILWQFKRWNSFMRHKKLFPVLIVILLITWIAENFIVGSFFLFNSYFTLLACAIIIMASIGMVNKILVTDRKGLSKNPIFIICVCFIIFYSYDATVEILWDYGAQLSDQLSVYIYNLLIYINLLVYIVYSYAILCMRSKLRFTMPS